MDPHVACICMGLSASVKHDFMEEYRERLRNELNNLRQHVISISLKKEYVCFQNDISKLAVYSDEILTTIDKNYEESTPYMDLLIDDINCEGVHSTSCDCESLSSVSEDDQFSQLYVIVYFIQVLELLETLKKILNRITHTSTYRKRRKTPLPAEIMNEKIEKNCVAFRVTTEKIAILCSLIKSTE